MKISLEKLQQKAAERPPGYLEECLAVGSVKDDYVYLTPAAYDSLRLKYTPSTPLPNLHSEIHAPRMSGLGDAVALIAKPFVRAIDHVAGTNLENCGGCKKRQTKLNAAIPFKRKLRDAGAATSG